MCHPTSPPPSTTRGICCTKYGNNIQNHRPHLFKITGRGKQSNQPGWLGINITFDSSLPHTADLYASIIYFILDLWKKYIVNWQKYISYSGTTQTMHWKNILISKSEMYMIEGSIKDTTDFWPTQSVNLAKKSPKLTDIFCLKASQSPQLTDFLSEKNPSIWQIRQTVHKSPLTFQIYWLFNNPGNLCLRHRLRTCVFYLKDLPF